MVLKKQCPGNKVFKYRSNNNNNSVSVYFINVHTKVADKPLQIPFPTATIMWILNQVRKYNRIVKTTEKVQWPCLTPECTLPGYPAAMARRESYQILIFAGLNMQREEGSAGTLLLSEMKNKQCKT